MNDWRYWKPTTGVQPRLGQCGTCISIRRNDARMATRSTFGCVEVGPYRRVKATGPRPAWCPGYKQRKRAARVTG